MELQSQRHAEIDEVGVEAYLAAPFRLRYLPKRLKSDLET
jgi:hypothetical protein